MEEAEDIKEFMANGRDALSSKANSVEEIGQERQRAKSLVDSLSTMMDKRRRVEEKNKLLRQMAGGGNAAQFATVDLKEIVSEWEGFTEKLEQHGQVLEERKGQLQQGIVKQVGSELCD